jgi:hypothetical protein
MTGGRMAMAENPTLFLGANHAALRTLIERLRAEGYWNEPTEPPDFSIEVEEAVRYFQQTHLGADGKSLAADGVVGPKTWWALTNASGDPQRSRIAASIPTGIGGLRERILQVALAEHARPVVEEPNGSNRGPFVDRYLPAWTKQPGKPGPYWCCFFYSWVIHEATGSWPLETDGPQGSCQTVRRLAGKLKRFAPKLIPNGRPIPGDAFVMDRGGGHGHIGFVLRVNAERTQINTVEGNCGNRVKVGLRELSDPEIVGFIDNAPLENGSAFELGIAEATNLGRASVV